MKLFIFLIVSILPICALSQNIISGYVFDSSHTGIQNASITYSKINSSIILGFAQTDNQGKFTLLIHSVADSITLNINHIGYEKISIQLQKIERKIYTFTLKNQRLLNYQV